MLLLGELTYNLLKWKVMNYNNSNEPRGEIRDRTTSQNPEKTA
jgi:hypothetical protein